jgi:hypothetical protein
MLLRPAARPPTGGATVHGVSDNAAAINIAEIARGNTRHNIYTLLLFANVQVSLLKRNETCVERGRELSNTLINLMLYVVEYNVVQMNEVK